METVEKNNSEKLTILANEIDEFEQNFYKIKREYKSIKLFDSIDEAKEAAKIAIPIMDKSIKEFVFTKQIEEILAWACDSESKGLGLIGSMGTGKTIMACSFLPFYFAKKLRQIPLVIKSYDINEEIFEIAKKRRIIVIDELAAEAPVNVYGTKYDFVPLIIDKCEAEGKLLIFTSNRSKQQIIERYGDPILDRIRKLCKIIIFEGKSFRN